MALRRIPWGRCAWGHPPEYHPGQSAGKTCPKCGFTITPDLVKQVDFERIKCPQCGVNFAAPSNRRSRCGLLRGGPVLSWHFSRGWTPQVGQGTEEICL